MTIDPKDFYEYLVARKVDMFCGVPDSLLKDFCAYISEYVPSERNIITANEGNAVGIACGYHVATGKSAAVYMQNSGEGNAVNPLLSIADPDVYSIPMLLIIGWRGEPGFHDEPQHVKQGKITCSMLDVMEIPHEILTPHAWEKQLDRLLFTMERESRPVAVVIRKNTFSTYPFSPDDSRNCPLSREEALETILNCMEDDDLIVSTTGKTSREVFEIRERRGQGHECDFLTVGGMGHTSSIAYGMALGTNADVWCLDGDGSFIMHMGAFPVMAQKMPGNLKYVLNVNGAHESVGGQPNVGSEIDIPSILVASGFNKVMEASTPEEIKSGMAILKENPRCALVISTHQGSRKDLGRPTSTPAENKCAMMGKIASMGKANS